MCGIIAYVGKKDCKSFILEGLTRIEYRGYDSSGIIFINEDNKRFDFIKAPGKLSVLKSKIEKNHINGKIGLGHIRWATHGIVDEANAHPLFDCNKQIAVVHNGIIEGHIKIKDKLSNSGHVFNSATDTETVAHLLESILPLHDNLHSALIELVSYLDGAFALGIMLEKYPDKMVAIRYKSPLAIGIGEDEMYVASDPLVFSDKTNKVLFIPDGSFAIISKDNVELFDFKGKRLPVVTQLFDTKFVHENKKEFDHYMLKEIYEQKQSIDRTISFYKNLLKNETSPHFNIINFSTHLHTNNQFLDNLRLDLNKIKSLKTIHLLGAGTSWYAARIAQFFFEIICGIPTRVHLSSEFRYMSFFPESDSIYIFISQSGETADTLEALRLVNSLSLPTIALTNVASSTMVQEANGFFLIQAGPEYSVCSTKAFSSFVASLYWLANYFALIRNSISIEEMKKAEEDILVAAEVLESSIDNYKNEIINGLAQYYSKFEKFIFLGRHISYPFAMEAALKLKEISYIFAQCYPSGELKHGPIALIDEKTPVVLFSNLDPIIYKKILSNAQEVKARKGHLLTFVFKGQDELEDLSDNSFMIPNVNPLLGPLAMTGLMQFFIYQVTKQLGLPIDKPRNLAKSVTVE